MKRMLLPFLFFFLASCASNPLMTGRKTASKDDITCQGLVNNILKDQQAQYFPSSQNAIIDEVQLKELTDKYGELSNAPEEIILAYQAFYNGKMSLSVFKKISSEFPNLKGVVSAIIFKDHLAVLHTLNPDYYSADGMLSIKKTFDELKKNYTIRTETNDYFIVDIALEGPRDAKTLGRLGTVATIYPLIFAKNEGIPTNRFFKMPKTIIAELEKAMVSPMDSRYVFTNNLKENRITLDAAKELINFSGQNSLSLEFHVYKSQLKNLKVSHPDSFKGDYRDIENSLIEIHLAGKYTKLAEADDSISYKIIIKSKDDLVDVANLFTLAVSGRISLLD